MAVVEVAEVVVFVARCEGLPWTGRVFMGGAAENTLVAAVCVHVVDFEAIVIVMVVVVRGRLVRGLCKWRRCGRQGRGTR